MEVHKFRIGAWIPIEIENTSGYNNAIVNNKLVYLMTLRKVKYSNNILPNGERLYQFRLVYINR